MSLYNEYELNTPEWLDEQFLETALKSYENNAEIKVTKIEFSPASMKGDHFSSLMFRAKVEYTIGSDAKKTTSLIVKTMFDEEDEGEEEEKTPPEEMLTQTKLFETEIDMYTKTLPAIMQVLAKHGDSITLVPRIIYSALKPHTVIILEDLSAQGYTTSRKRYPTQEEMQRIYTKLAKLHAVSFMLAQSAEQEKRELVTKYKDGIFSNSMAFTSEMISGGIKNFIEMLAAHAEFAKYVPKFQALASDLFVECKRLYRAYQQGCKDQEIFVLNHGDFHMKNLMFKFNANDEMEDFIILDFQISVFGPPLIDLIYSTFMLMSPALRAQQRDALMHYYFEQFIATLNLIEFQGELPKFADIQMASIRYRSFSVFMLTTFLPLLISKLALQPEEIKDDDSSNSLFVNGDKFASFYRNPNFINEVRKLLPLFLNAGFLD